MNRFPFLKDFFANANHFWGYARCLSIFKQPALELVAQANRWSKSSANVLQHAPKLLMMLSSLNFPLTINSKEQNELC